MEQTESCFFLLPRAAVTGTNGCVQPRRSVAKDSLPTGSLFRHSSFLAPLQVVCLSTKSSCGLSCSESSYLFTKGLILQNAELWHQFLLTSMEGPQHSTGLGLETFQEKVTLMGNCNRGLQVTINHVVWES